ncbi:hypothetical protein GOP47_0005800 [Adiantum capillus-veneris]|uniref:Pentatricopeptide repeat-containing protein n=1 Tax=Adiantum capillus-veneris TaxID=13818 RepID=A0A9D4ZNV9_ADICA|nr:hypothetical protein GOP47_0005800 [Adiantum capillus-veneris]
MHHVRPSLKLYKPFLFNWVKHASLSPILSHTLHKAYLPRQAKVTPTVHDYAGWLKGCTHSLSLHKAHVIHADIVDNGLEFLPIVGSALVNMYSKCGSFEDACKVFDMVSVRDVVLWSAIIVACANHRHAEKGLHLFEQMQLEEGIPLDKQLLTYAVKACAGMRALEEGRRTHIIITKQGLEADEFVGNSLVDMYCKCGSLKDAHGVFDYVGIRDVVFWTALICGHVESSLNKEALKLFWKMHEEGIKPNRITYQCIIRACSSVETMEEGKKIFADIVKLGFFDSHVGVDLIRMYCTFENLNDAHKVFSVLNAQDIVSYTVLITGYAEQEHGEEALRLYKGMRKGGAKPDEAIFVCVLKICSQLGASQEAQVIYFDIMSEGLDSLLCIKQSLMDMYIKCVSLEDAFALFESFTIQDVVSFSTIIAGYVLHGYDTECLKLFEDMQISRIQPNEKTYTSILKACARLKKLEYGKHIHNHLMILGFESDVFIRSTLIDMYAGCRRVEEACSIFSEGSDVVLWNTMMGIYVEHDLNRQALQLYEQLCHQDLGSSYVTLLWLIKACSDIEQGRRTHTLAVKQGWTNK